MDVNHEILDWNFLPSAKALKMGHRWFFHIGNKQVTKEEAFK